MPNRCFVYTLLDGERRPLYVGRTFNVANRLRLHMNECRRLESIGDTTKAAWFYRTRSLAVAGPYTPDIGARVERTRIELLQPEGNKGRSRS